jgi:phosphonatase-like hydrolase
MVKMMVFDMAGTTINENNVVYKTLRKAIIEEGYNISLLQVLTFGAGKEKRVAIQSIMQNVFQEDAIYIIEDIYNAFIIDLYKAYENLDILPQTNAEELFKILKEKKIKIVLNTGYNEAIAKLLLEKLNWQIGITIDALITAEDVANNRPHPDMIYLAMQKFNITDAIDVIKVGDSIVDIEEGKNAGCLMSIGITTGAHTYEQLQQAKPDYIINNLMDLVQFI